MDATFHFRAVRPYGFVCDPISKALLAQTVRDENPTALHAERSHLTRSLLR